MSSIRQSIFTSPNGTIEGMLLPLLDVLHLTFPLDISALMTDAGAYGR